MTETQTAPTTERKPLDPGPITARLMVVNSPWGAVDYRRMIAPGVVFVETPSHGGALVSPELVSLIPENLRTRDGWYEEDCEIAAVIATWPDYFTEAAVTQARAAIATGRDVRMQRGGRHPLAGTYAPADGITHD